MESLRHLEERHPKRHSELWDEAKTESPHEILGSIVREELKKEKIERIDLTYVGNEVNQWWARRNGEAVSVATHSGLKLLILQTLQSQHLEIIRSVGSSRSRISAVLLEHLFHIPNKGLARLVHETMAEIAGLVDIKYPYEDHKELFPKNQNQVASDWGRGLGIIRPHSDDLYEERAVTAMCLTVCRDTSCTPTWFWRLQDVIAPLTDSELGILVLSDAIFLSGRNVEGRTIEVSKPVLRRDPDEGIGLRLDFRIDDEVGPRMKFENPAAQAILDKMRSALRDIKPASSNPSTGSVSILSNHKVLHGRSALNPIMLYEGEDSRILFRSKGTK